MLYQPKHKVKAGRYTYGGEYVTLDGKEYKGYFHLRIGGIAYSGAEPSTDSQRLYQR